MLRRFAPKAVNARHMATQPSSTQINTSSLMMSQRRNSIEIMSVWYLASWMCMWYWTIATFAPMMVMDFCKPSAVANKIPMLHYFQEKRTEMKLQGYLDEISTEWQDSVDPSQFDEVIQRSILP